MRIDVKKYLFVGVDKKKFFHAAQEAGIVHFVAPKPCAKKELPEAVQRLTAAIKILRSQPIVEQEDGDLHISAANLVDKILHQKEELGRLAEQERLLQLEIARIEPFGNYVQEDVEWIERESKRKLQFYCMKEGLEEAPQELIPISNANEMNYFIAFNPTPRQFETAIEIKPEAPLHELQQRLKLVSTEKHDVEVYLKQMAKFSKYLRHALVDKVNGDHLSDAEECAEPAMEGKLFTAEGWVSKDKENTIHEIAERLDVYIEEIAVDAAEAAPTHLENRGLARIGEDLVHIYDTPSTNDKDPSLWVLFFFALFFSMIIGDGGYGLILLVAGFFAARKMKKKTKSGRRALALLYILGGFCIAWGLLTTSFFGITFAPDSPVRKISALTWLVEKKVDYHFTQNDRTAASWIERFPDLTAMNSPKEILIGAATADPKTGALSYEMLNAFSNDILLELALFIGCLHIILSIGRKLKEHLPGIGWIIFVLGCYLYFPKFVEATTVAQYGFGIDKSKGQEIGSWMIFGGIGIALFFAILKDKLFGLLEAMNMLQIFADAMSYLRLYALGLSGALVISTMNEMAAGVPLIFAGLILIFGHAVNLVLCIMGGVIHGLRLNFLEWYHYSFEGGGKRFNPLKKIELEE